MGSNNHSVSKYATVKEEGRLAAQSFSRLILTAWCVLLAALVAGVYFRDWQMVQLPFAGCLFLLIPFFLARRGHAQISGFLVVLVVLVIVTALAADSQGIRDIGILAFPLVLIFAGLTIRRSLFRVTVLLTLLATVALIVSEELSLFAARLPNGSSPNWFYLVGVTLILVLAALAVDILATTMRKNMEVARQEYLRRLEVDDSLRTSEAQYRFLVNHTSDDIVRIDAHGIMVFVSDTARNFLGYDPSELLLRQGADFVHPEDRARYTAAVRTAVETGLPGRAEYRLQRKDGAFLWVEATGRRVFRTSGQPEVILVQRDTTERKRTEMHNRLIFEVQAVLLRPDPNLDIFELVSEKVGQLVENDITVIITLDEKHSTVRLGSFHGADIPLEKLAAALGFDPLTEEYPVQDISEENLQIYRSPHLVTLEGGLATLVHGNVPQPACLLIEKMLGLQDVYTMGFIHNEFYLGSLIILARSDISQHISTIEQIVNMATIAVESMRAEAEVANSARRFNALIENGRDNITLLAADGSLLWENPSSRASLGYSPDVFVGHSIFGLLHPEESAAVLASFKEMVVTPGAVREVQFRLRHADGSWRWMEGTAANLLTVPYVEAVVLNYRDITERKRAEDALRESEERFKLSMEATNDGLWDWDITTGGDYFSPGYYRMLGYAVEDFPMRSSAWDALIHPDDREAARQVNQDCIEGLREQFEVEYRMKAKNGEWRWILGRGKCVARGPDGRALRLLGTHMDITPRKQIEAALQAKTEELDHYFSTSLDLFCIADADGHFRRLNPQWEAALGYSLAELTGKHFMDFVHPDDEAATQVALAQLAAQEQLLNFENRYRCKDGTYLWLEWRSVPVGNLVYAAARDITERKNLEAQLRYQSTHDDMTRIYNRAYFEEELARFERGREYPVSIVIADFDRLKSINDNLGHPFGDELLRQTARVLSSVFRAGDVLARLGGDEFGALLPLTDAQSVAQIVTRIRESLADYNVRTLDVPLELSIGAATGEHGSLAEVFTLADQRMYANKAVRKAQAQEDGVRVSLSSGPA